MSKVDAFESCNDDELDQLFKKLQLVEPDSNWCKANNTVPDDSQVTLFENVGTPTNEVLISEMGLAPDERNYREG